MLNSKISKHKHYQMQKINKNTYTKQKIYIKIQKYTEHKRKVKTKTPKTTQIQTATYIYDIKKIYTTYKIYQTEKYTPKKSNTHKKIALITKKYTTRTMPNTVIYANTCNTHNLKEESKQN